MLSVSVLSVPVPVLSVAVSVLSVPVPVPVLSVASVPVLFINLMNTQILCYTKNNFHFQFS